MVILLPLKKYCFLLLSIISFSLFGQYTERKHKIDSLAKLTENATTKADKLKASREILNVLGDGNPDSVLLFVNRALSAIGKDLNFEKEKVFYLDALGRVYISQGEYDKAMTYYLEGLRIAEKSNIIIYITPLHVNIGAIYDRQKQFDEALKHYQEAVQLINENPLAYTAEIKSAYLANIYNNMGNIFLSENDTLKSTQYYEKALKESNDPRLQALLLNNLGNNLLAMGEYESGRRNIQQSLKLRKQINDLQGTAQSYRNLGYYFVKKNYYDSAIVAFNQGLSIARKIHAQYEISQIYEGLFQSYEGKHEYAKALTMHQKFKATSDSLFNDNKSIEITKLKNRYEFEKEQARLLHLQQTRELKFYLYIGLLLILVVLALMVVYAQRNRIKKAKLLNDNLQLQQKSLELEKVNLNLDLEHKSKELTTTVLYMYKKNELITNILSELDRMRPSIRSEENKPLFDRIVRDLGKLTEEDIWREFETRFNDVHMDFYKTLQDRFPELTPNERKLCAFLKLNMTSKEVSSITGQSIRGIDVARTRLRKKLNLTNAEINLVDFLSNL